MYSLHSFSDANTPPSPTTSYHHQHDNLPAPQPQPLRLARAGEGRAAPPCCLSPRAIRPAHAGRDQAAPRRRRLAELASGRAPLHPPSLLSPPPSPYLSSTPVLRGRPDAEPCPGKRATRCFLLFVGSPLLLAVLEGLRRAVAWSRPVAVFFLFSFFLFFFLLRPIAERRLASAHSCLCASVSPRQIRAGGAVHPAQLRRASGAELVGGHAPLVFFSSCLVFLLLVWPSAERRLAIALFCCCAAASPRQIRTGGAVASTVEVRRAGWAARSRPEAMLLLFLLPLVLLPPSCPAVRRASPRGCPLLLLSHRQSQANKDWRCCLQRS